MVQADVPLAPSLVAEAVDTSLAALPLSARAAPAAPAPPPPRVPSLFDDSAADSTALLLASSTSFRALATPAAPSAPASGTYAPRSALPGDKLPPNDEGSSAVDAGLLGANVAHAPPYRTRPDAAADERGTPPARPEPPPRPQSPADTRPPPAPALPPPSLSPEAIALARMTAPSPTRTRALDSAPVIVPGPSEAEPQQAAVVGSPFVFPGGHMPLPRRTPAMRPAASLPSGAPATPATVTSQSLAGVIEALQHQQVRLAAAVATPPPASRPATAGTRATSLEAAPDSATRLLAVSFPTRPPTSGSDQRQPAAGAEATPPTVQLHGGDPGTGRARPVTAAPKSAAPDDHNGMGRRPRAGVGGAVPVVGESERAVAMLTAETSPALMRLRNGRSACPPTCIHVPFTAERPRANSKPTFLTSAKQARAISL